VLLYLRHEGRGIGLFDKVRAYALQDDGLDTVDANVALGLPIDARDWASAAAVLRRRVQNSPPDRHEARWLPGWLNRVQTYRQSS